MLYNDISQRIGDGLYSHEREKNLENLMHGKRKKESLPQGIIKPLGDDDDDGRFSLDEAIDMVSQRRGLSDAMTLKFPSRLHPGKCFLSLQRKSSDFISAHANEDEPWHMNSKSGFNQ